MAGRDGTRRPAPLRLDGTRKQPSLLRAAAGDGRRGTSIVSDSAADKPKGEKAPRRTGKSDPLVAAAIGQKLRTMYDDMLSEPVPSDLAELVRRLSGGTDDKAGG